MRNFSTVIKSLREERHLSQRELAKKLGISPSSLAMYETNEREPNQEIKEIIAEFFNVDLNYLHGKTPIRNSYRDLDIDMSIGVRIPVLGTVPAGIPIEAIEDIVDYEEIPQSMASTGEFYGLRIKGDSMSPRILDGDVVIVSKQSNIDSGDIAIVMVNGFDATCKKVLIKENGIMLQPLNPNFETVFYTPEQIGSLPVNVIGKVVELRGKF